jgi:hypothetical protein
MKKDTEPIKYNIVQYETVASNKNLVIIKLPLVSRQQLVTPSCPFFSSSS